MEKTEMMKRYEVETGKKALVTVKVGFAELVFPSNEYTSWLESQLTWRPVSEKPEKKTGQILCKRQVKVNSKEFTRLYPADMCDIEDWAHFVKKLEIVSYLPIPPAPEGE